LEQKQRRWPLGLKRVWGLRWTAHFSNEGRGLEGYGYRDSRVFTPRIQAGDGVVILKEL